MSINTPMTITSVTDVYNLLRFDAKYSCLFNRYFKSLASLTAHTEVNGSRHLTSFQNVLFPLNEPKVPWYGVIIRFSASSFDWRKSAP